MKIQRWWQGQGKLMFHTVGRQGNLRNRLAKNRFWPKTITHEKLHLVLMAPSMVFVNMLLVFDWKCTIMRILKMSSRMRNRDLLMAAEDLTGWKFRALTEYISLPSLWHLNVKFLLCCESSRWCTPTLPSIEPTWSVIEKLSIALRKSRAA